MAMRPVPVIGSSAIVEWNSYEHRIHSARELLLSGVGVCPLICIGVLGRVTRFRDKWASVRKNGRRIHSVDRTYFAKRGLIAARIIGKGLLTVYRAFPDLAVRLYRRGRRLDWCGGGDLCRRRRRYECRRPCGRRLGPGHWVSDYRAWRLRMLGCCASVSGTKNNGHRHGRHRQSAEDPRQEISILVHGHILPLL